MISKKYLIVPSLIFIVFITGCIGGQVQISPQEIKNNTIQTTENINTYKYNVDMSTEMAIKEGGGQTNFSLFSRTTGGGDVNITDQRSRTNLTQYIVISSGENPQPPNLFSRRGNSSVYIIGNTGYFLSDIFNRQNNLSDDLWVKSDLPQTQTSWRMQNQLLLLNQQTGLLNTTDNIELVGEEQINNKDSYILEISPDKQSLLRFIQQQTSNSMVQDQAYLTDKRAIKNSSIRYWISKQNNQPIKTNITVSITPNISGLDPLVNISLQNKTIESKINIETTYTDINQPINIKLPTKAQNATDITNIQ